MKSMQGWYRRLFGPDYLKLDWHDTTEAEVEGLIRMLSLDESDRVLDLCCGYGRHAVPLASHGCQVTGLDLSEAMLAEAEANAQRADCRVDWVRADVRDVPFEAEFDVALNLFTSFGYFEREGDNLAALAAAREALVPGGYFVLDTINHDYMVRSFQPENWYDRPEGWVLERREFDALESRVNSTWTLIEPDGSTRSYPNSIRTYTFAELRTLLTLVGFDVLQANGGYKGETLDWNAARMVIVSRRPLD
jgi:SAM-dependent methyltransferase